MKHRFAELDDLSFGDQRNVTSEILCFSYLRNHFGLELFILHEYGFTTGIIVYLYKTPETSLAVFLWHPLSLLECDTDRLPQDQNLWVAKDRISFLTW